MLLLLDTITLEIDPMLRLGPITLAWHGVATAAGVTVGAALAWRWAGPRGLDRDEVVNLAIVAMLAGIVGARLLYLVEQEPGDLLRPTELVGGRGFSIYGAIVLGALAAGAYAWRRGLGLRHLDALAVGFPLGMAVGRLGDIVNGEHYGPPSDLPWAIAYTHPDAGVPSSAVAYHPGGLYEVVLALAITPLVWWVARRARRPGLVLCSAIGLYGAGRFLMFFYRSDSETIAAGLNAAQLTSLLLVATALAGTWWLSRRAGIDHQSPAGDGGRTPTVRSAS
jgi:phosphatidylglycerol:prolipoprotein diacylglycerol transferase